MQFLLSNEASKYIQQKYEKINDDPLIKVYQINKEACSGSYLDYYVELSSKKEVISPEFYKKYDLIDREYGAKMDIYVEKRILGDFEGLKNILIDLKIINKFNENFVSLILKEHK